MAELIVAILSVLGGALMIALGWLAARAIRFQSRADSSRRRRKRDSHWMDGGGKPGPNYVGGGGYAPGDYVGGGQFF